MSKKLNGTVAIVTGASSGIGHATARTLADHGASSMWAWQFATMQHAAEVNGWMKFISMQDQYSVIHREEEREMFGLLTDRGVGSIPWSPLAGGVVARPWGDQSTTRGQHSASTDFDGRPLWLDCDRAIADAEKPYVLREPTWF